MEFADVLRRRRMVRRYDGERPIAPAVLDRVVRAGLRGPSAGFSQGVELLVLAAPVDVERYWRATVSPGPPDAWLRGMRTAAALVVCLSDPRAYLDRYAEADKGQADRDPAGWPVPYWDVDAGMGAALMLLAAVDEGLGACFFGVPGPRHEAVRDAFGIPTGLRLVGVVALGYPASDERPAGSGRRRRRRPLTETLHHGRYGSGPHAPTAGTTEP